MKPTQLQQHATICVDRKLALPIAPNRPRGIRHCRICPARVRAKAKYTLASCEPDEATVAGTREAHVNTDNASLYFQRLNLQNDTLVK